LTTTMATLPARGDAGGMNGRPSDPEVPEKPKRRKFSAEYKLRILAEADATLEGAVGALLRREGIYYSHLIDWRNQRAKGTLGTAKPGRLAVQGPQRRRAGVPPGRERAAAAAGRAGRGRDRCPKKTLKAAWDRLGNDQARRQVMIATAEELAPAVGTRAACDALSVARATVYRRRKPPTAKPAGDRPKGSSALRCRSPSANRCWIWRTRRASRTRPRRPA
jgi:transposase-like protein